MIPRRLASWARFFMLSAGLHGCGSGTASPERPQPTLATSLHAQDQFRELSERWHAGYTNQRNSLEPELRRFLLTHGDDDLARMARVYLAWILIKKDRLVEAGRLIESTRRGPKGAAQDFSVVAEAALLIRYGRPQEGLKLLRRLQGKIIDPVERFLATEQLVQAAMAARLYDESLLYMVDWMEQAAADVRDDVRATIDTQLRAMPRPVLERALASLMPELKSDEHEADLRREQSQWLFERVAQRLAEIALNSGDVALARKVLARSPKSVSWTFAQDLVKLSAGGRVPARIDGHTIGILMSSGSPALRRRASEVAFGIQRSLAFEQPELVSVDLVTSKENQQPGSVANGLSELARQGASLFVAGLDEWSATNAAREAERLQIPLLLLHPQQASALHYTFTLGVSEPDELQTLETGLEQRNIQNVVAIGPGSGYCDAPIDGRPSFPIPQWQRQGVEALLLLDDSACTHFLFDALAASRFRPLLAFGLEGTLEPEVNALQLRVSAGGFPYARTPQPPGVSTPSEQRSQMVEAWVSHTGRPPSWYEALGWDCGTIAVEVFSRLPRIASDDGMEVTRFHNAVLRRLRGASQSVLLTSNLLSFDEKQHLVRQLATR